MIDTVRASLLATANLHAEMAESLAEPCARAAELLIASLQAGGTIYICGNGGSAAEAQHAAGELVGRFLCERPALRCVALTTDTSVLTAIANDYEYSRIFARQAEALVRQGDVLWGLSTSGMSPNVLAAADVARRRGAKLAELCDVCLCIPADMSPGIQEGHLALIHILCRLVEEAMVAHEKGRR